MEDITYLKAEFSKKIKGAKNVPVEGMASSISEANFLSAN